MLLRVHHKVTLHHWRSNRRNKRTSLAICSCGWHDSVFRLPWKYKLKRVWCRVTDHQWEPEPHIVKVGHAGFEDGEEIYSWSNRQCERCLKVERNQDPGHE